MMTYHEKIARLVQLTGAADASIEDVLAKLRRAYPTESELRARIGESEALIVALAMMLDGRIDDELRRYVRFMLDQPVHPL